MPWPRYKGIIMRKKQRYDIYICAFWIIIRDTISHAELTNWQFMGPNATITIGKSFFLLSSCYRPKYINFSYHIMHRADIIHYPTSYRILSSLNRCVYHIGVASHLKNWKRSLLRQVIYNVLQRRIKLTKTLRLTNKLNITRWNIYVCWSW